ncbi:ferritin-like domain-containing protein [Hymenobacter tenuis]
MTRYSTTSSSNSNDSLSDQAQQWLSQSSVSDLLSGLSPALKNVGTQATAQFNKLSTTQKIVGGALLVLGVGYFSTRGKASATSSDGQVNTLQELLLFINDRIEGYQRAVAESTDAELRGYYKQLVSQSQQFSNELNAALREEGESRQTGTTLKGKLYRRWMDAKAAVTGQDEKAILGSNIFGEEWALKAYQDALSKGQLSDDIRQSVERQYALAQKTYDKLKSLQAQQQ